MAWIVGSAAMLTTWSDHCPRAGSVVDVRMSIRRSAETSSRVTTMTERVLIYGSRTWRDPEPIRAFVNSLPAGTVVVHGGQRSWDRIKREYFGADHFADVAAKARGLVREIHRAEWARLGRRAGPFRNQEMADSKPDRAQGFRMPGESTGTDGMTTLLVAAGIPHEVVTP